MSERAGSVVQNGLYTDLCNACNAQDGGSSMQCCAVPVQYGLHLLSDSRSQQNASAGLGASIDEGKRKKTSKLGCCNAIRVVTRWSRAFVFRVGGP